MVRHSHEDALSESEYKALLKTTSKLPPAEAKDCYIMLLLGGRLGMRAGEIAHMRDSWIDWERKQIQIPTFDPCTKGRGGARCGYCKSQSRQSVNYPSNDRTLEEELETRWKPKTPTSARTIPFDHSDRIETALREFFSDHDQYPRCRSSMNRRMDALAEAAGMEKHRLYPHCLRSTAATYWAYEGLSVVPLQSLFGWSSIDTAQKYIRISGGATSKALNEVHGDD